MPASRRVAATDRVRAEIDQVFSSGESSARSSRRCARAAAAPRSATPSPECEADPRPRSCARRGPWPLSVAGPYRLD